jgi:DNA-directed RNA polymerase subunit RPC12/RpoP
MVKLNFGTASDTVGGIKQMLGMKTKSDQENTSPGTNQPKQIVSAYCSSCGAAISGIEGDIVKCQYCENEQMLQVRTPSAQATPEVQTPEQAAPVAPMQPDVGASDQDTPTGNTKKKKSFGKRVAKAGADVAKDAVKDTIKDGLNPFNWL